MQVFPIIEDKHFGFNSKLLFMGRFISIPKCYEINMKTTMNTEYDVIYRNDLLISLQYRFKTIINMETYLTQSLLDCYFKSKDFSSYANNCLEFIISDSKSVLLTLRVRRYQHLFLPRLILYQALTFYVLIAKEVTVFAVNRYFLSSFCTLFIIISVPFLVLLELQFDFHHT